MAYARLAHRAYRGELLVAVVYPVELYANICDRPTDTCKAPYTLSTKTDTQSTSYRQPGFAGNDRVSRYDFLFEPCANMSPRPTDTYMSTFTSRKKTDTVNAHKE